MTYGYWLMAALIFVIVEILPPATHFVGLGFALGALGAAIASWIGAPVWVCAAVFTAVSAASMPILVPLAKFLFHQPPSEDLAARELVGQSAVVLESIPAGGVGTIRVGDDFWRARSDDGAHEVTDPVVVRRVEDVHAIVTRRT